MYIGASLSAVNSIIHSKRLRFGVDLLSKSPKLIHVQGLGGAKRLRGSLNDKLIARWWRSGPGTKIVVAWVHSDALNGKNHLVAVSLVRPVLNSTAEDPERIFYTLLENKLRRLDKHTFRLHQMSTYAIPTFVNVYGGVHATSHFYVWPNKK